MNLSDLKRQLPRSEKSATALSDDAALTESGEEVDGGAGQSQPIARARDSSDHTKSTSSSALNSSKKVKGSRIDDAADLLTAQDSSQSPPAMLAVGLGGPDPREPYHMFSANRRLQRTLMFMRKPITKKSNVFARLKVIMLPSTLHVESIAKRRAAKTRGNGQWARLESSLEAVQSICCT